MASGPSDKAVEAARATIPRGAGHGLHKTTDAALKAAHDPALGLDRSVCLRDVVKVLRIDWPRALFAEPPNEESAADFIEREFGGKHD